MEKLILKKQRYRANDNTYRIRVSGEMYEYVEDLSRQTNMSMTEIVSKMLRFASEHIEIEGGTENER